MTKTLRRNATQSLDSDAPAAPNAISNTVAESTTLPRNRFTPNQPTGTPSRAPTKNTLSTVSAAGRERSKRREKLIRSGPNNDDVAPKRTKVAVALAKARGRKMTSVNWAPVKTLTKTGPTLMNKLLGVAEKESNLNVIALPTIWMN